MGFAAGALRIGDISGGAEAAAASQEGGVRIIVVGLGTSGDTAVPCLLRYIALSGCKAGIGGVPVSGRIVFRAVEEVRAAHCGDIRRGGIPVDGLVCRYRASVRREFRRRRRRSWPAAATTVMP